ncbi:hypothetical protein C7271_09080 [filamentous cyanobacterium CCP5]|nr:hypothetical protein C7271_09080 [filamentous cyanobacterium CCP5]
MPRDEAALLDAARFAQNIQDLMQGIDRHHFNSDLRTQSAILYQLTVLGEAVKRLSMEFRQRHLEIEWKAIAGLRDKVTHQYDQVDLDIVWETVQRDIPDFLEKLAPLLPPNPS